MCFGLRHSESSSGKLLRCSGHHTRGGASSRVAWRPRGSLRKNGTISEDGPPRAAIPTRGQRNSESLSTLQKSVSRVIAQGPEGDRLGVQETMFPLHENLTKKGHDTHKVAKIAENIGEWSARETRETGGKVAALTKGNLENKTEENRGSALKEIAGSELKEIEGSELKEIEGPQLKEVEGSFKQNPNSQINRQKWTSWRQKNQETRHAKAASGTDQSDFIAGLLCVRVWKDSNAYSAPARFLLDGPWSGLLLVCSPRARRPVSRGLYRGLQTVRVQSRHKGIR